MDLEAETSLLSTSIANILLDFYDGEDDGDNDQIPNKSQEIGTEADDENSATERDMKRKPGHRYTAADFDFLEEEWLERSEGSSEDLSSFHSDDE